MLTQTIDKNVAALRKTLEELLNQRMVPYANATPASFPERKGLYVITSGDGEVLRAGKTGLKNATLRQRLYNNHLMGNQNGNLPAQLIGSKQCLDLEAAKTWIKRYCSVRFLPIDNEVERSRIEHFMLAVLQPRFCDNNKWD